MSKAAVGARRSLSVEGESEAARVVSAEAFTGASEVGRFAVLSQSDAALTPWRYLCNHSRLSRLTSASSNERQPTPSPARPFPVPHHSLLHSPENEATMALKPVTGVRLAIERVRARGAPLGRKLTITCRCSEEPSCSISPSPWVRLSEEHCWEEERAML